MTRPRDSFSPWQSFADLAMGLMAVFALVLIVLLWSQGKTNERLATETRNLEAQKTELEAQKAHLLARQTEIEALQSRFAIELIELLDSTHAIVRAQDGAEAWVRAVFDEEGCPLELTELGTLQRRHDGHRSADLYRPGETQLHPEGIEALRACQRSFMRLAYCLSPDSAGGDSPGAQARARLCLGELARDGAPDELAQLRTGLEAIVLQGNTDRTPLSDDQIPPIRDGRGRLRFVSDAGGFVNNAHLGAERARQALGHLLHLAEENNADPHDALEVLMARVRIESPSFGRYQAGPVEWREPGCRADQTNCEAARNLSLRLRWRKEQLRAPYSAMRDRLCALMDAQESAFGKGLEVLRDNKALLDELGREHPELGSWLEAGDLDVTAMQRRLGCAEVAGR